MLLGRHPPRKPRAPNLVEAEAGSRVPLARLTTLTRTPQLVTITWFFWGYSLTFAEGGSSFIGNLNNFGLKGVLGQPSVATSKIPALLFSFFQLQFATVTACIAVGGAAERIRTAPLFLWIFCWSTIVCASTRPYQTPHLTPLYSVTDQGLCAAPVDSPVAHWVWSPE